MKGLSKCQGCFDYVCDGSSALQGSSQTGREDTPVSLGRAPVSTREKALTKNRTEMGDSAQTHPLKSPDLLTRDPPGSGGECGPFRKKLC